MKISRVKIKNFKCLGPEEIKFDFSDDIIILIGKNNTGKSSVLKALDYFFSGIKTIPDDYFYNQLTDFDHAIVIEVEFNNLSSQDKEHQAVSSYYYDNEDEETWTLRKVYYKDEDGKGVCDYICIKGGEELGNPAGRQTNVDDLFTDEKMQKIYVEAVKEVTEASQTAAKSTFGQLFNLLLKPELEVTGEYKSLMSAIDDYRNLFQGGNKLNKIKELEQTINNRVARIISVSSKIDAEPPKADKVLPVPKLLTNDNRDIDVLPEQQGNGFQRTLIFALLELLAESTSIPDDDMVGPRNIVLIEEPEIYMHPQMERRIADVLYKIASDKKAQVICTTHSPVFINISDKQKSLARMIRETDKVTVIQKIENIFSDPGADNKRKLLKMIGNFDPTTNEAFFADRVVLVEGHTEIAVMRESAELVSYFDSPDNFEKKRSTTFINCRSRDSIPAFQEVLNYFKIDYVVLHDKEGEDLTSGTNGKILDLLGGDESRRKVSTDKIENILGITAGGNKELAAVNRVNELHNNSRLDRVFGDYIKFVYNIN
ncbi:MAG: AAA family ATPase [bacterium]|nr:AAA family ATPase [bacterium]